MSAQDTSSLTRALAGVTERADLCRRLPGETITLQIRVDEAVTPDHLAQRVAEACQAYGALRPGEAIILPSMSSREYRIVARSTT